MLDRKQCLPFHLPFSDSVFIEPFVHPKTKRYVVTKMTTYLVVDQGGGYEMQEHSYGYEESQVEGQEAKEISQPIFSSTTKVCFNGQLGQTWRAPEPIMTHEEESKVDDPEPDPT